MGTGAYGVTPSGSRPGAALAVDGQLLAAAVGLRITAFTADETAGAAAEFNLHHGTSNAGPIIAYVSAAANQRQGGDWGGIEVEVPNGVYLDVLSGAVSVVPFSKTAT